jgi:ParB family chromosome partitioning protein
MAPKHGLGKGMAALLSRNSEAPEQEAPAAAGTNAPPESAFERMIPLEKLRPNPDQPRKRFDDGELGELADSIKAHGIIQPIIAEDAGDGTFIIIAGERRSRAAKMAGLTQAPVIVRDYSDEKRMIVSIIENVQREDLNPIEEAAAYRRLMDLAGLSQDEAAAKVGKNRSTVANALRLLKLPPEMQESVKAGGVSPGHARAILSLDSPKNQDMLFREILARNLSVRDAERRAAALESRAAGQPPVKKSARAPELDAMEEKFIHRLGTRVAVNGDLNKGTVVIDYYSMEDLDRLYEILGG